MGWILNQFKKRAETEEAVAAGMTFSEGAVGLRERQAWSGLLQEFARDVREFQRLGGDCTWEQPTDLECRISNSSAGIAVQLAADLSAETIEYSYQPCRGKTSVPEGGILTLRPSGDKIEIYSADQRLTSELARQLVLEPLLFPTLPTDVAATQP
jgi:hypothetical protein